MLDKKQRFRLLNTLLAAGGGLVLSFIWIYAFYMERMHLSLGALIFCLIFFWCVSAAIVGLILTNINLRFNDPSMTIAQMYWAGSTSVVSLFLIEDMRLVIYLLMFLILAFGVLQAKTKQFNTFAFLMFVGIAIYNFYLALSADSEIELADILFESVVVGFCIFAITSLCHALNALKRRLKKQNYQLDKALHAKREFLAVMSHELRTPLNGIIGMLSLTLRKCDEGVIKERLEGAKKNSDELLSLINEILDYSQIEMDAEQENKIAINLESFIESIVACFTNQLEKSAVELNTVFDDSLPKSIHLKVNLLQKLLYILIDNAIKFTQQGSVLVSFTAKDRRSNGGQLIVSVQDTGVGIEAKNLNVIFEPFKQVDGSSTRNYGGTGMGLALAAKIVELLGGEIKVESEINQGSCFTVLLPY